MLRETFLGWGGGDGCSSGDNSSTSSGGGGGGGDMNGGFVSTGGFQIPYLENDGLFCDSQCTEVANKRIIETPKQNNQQIKLADALLKLRPFGLKLDLSFFPLDSVDNNNNNYNNNDKNKHSNQAVESYDHPKLSDHLSQPISEKLKAANFEATFLRIGKWERRKKNEGDLMAKCYFAKKKLVWEFLHGNLKNKIEISWNDIIGMRSFIQDQKPGILEIELNQAPTFFQEIDPQPRKHTIWKPTPDFTEGEASTYRRHYVVFPPGSLDKHYEKLLQSDQRLYALNHKRFPSLKTPYFERNLYNFSSFSSDYQSDSSNINLGKQFNFASIPSPLVSTHPPQYFKEITSPVSVMDFSHSDDMAIWAAHQGINNNGKSLPPIPPLAVCYQNYNPPSSAYVRGNDCNMVNNMLSNLEEHLFSDHQVVNYDEKYHMARIQPLNALANLSQEESASEESSQQIVYGQEMGSANALIMNTNGFGGRLTVNSAQQTFYGEGMDTDNGFILRGNQQPSGFVGQVAVYQQSVPLPSALHPQNFMMNYTLLNPDPGADSFGQDNNNQLNHWN